MFKGLICFEPGVIILTRQVLDFQSILLAGVTHLHSIFIFDKLEESFNIFHSFEDLSIKLVSVSLGDTLNSPLLLVKKVRDTHLGGRDSGSYRC